MTPFLALTHGCMCKIDTFNIWCQNSWCHSNCDCSINPINNENHFVDNFEDADPVLCFSSTLPLPCMACKFSESIFSASPSYE